MQRVQDSSRNSTSDIMIERLEDYQIKLTVIHAGFVHGMVRTVMFGHLTGL